jgi:hypothetical protein
MSEETGVQLLKYFRGQIKMCKESAERSKAVKANPVNYNELNMDEYYKRVTAEEEGELRFNFLKEQFLGMASVFESMGANGGAYSLTIANEIEKAREEAL